MSHTSRYLTTYILCCCTNYKLSTYNYYVKHLQTLKYEQWFVHINSTLIVHNYTGGRRATSCVCSRLGSSRGGKRSSSYGMSIICRFSCYCHYTHINFPSSTSPNQFHECTIWNNAWPRTFLKLYSYNSRLKYTSCVKSCSHWMKKKHKKLHCLEMQYSNRYATHSYQTYESILSNSNSNILNKWNQFGKSWSESVTNFQLEWPERMYNLQILLVYHRDHRYLPH